MRSIPLIFLIAASAAAQGYDKTTWGMTEAQVRAAYPQAIWFTTGRSGAQLKNRIRYTTAIQDIPVEVFFIFQNDKLSMVTIDSTLDNSGTILTETLAATKLRGLLRDKYGAPTGAKRDPEWVLDTMTVRTTSMAVAGHLFFTIYYIPRSSTPGL
jgi:hypothetical protein